MADLAVVALGLDATGMTSGATQANRALASVEKEMTQAEKQSQQLGKGLGGLGGSFALVAGGAVGAVTAVAGLAHAFTALTLEGVKLSGVMRDIAEGTGLSIDEVQRLSAAFKLAGEDIGGVERSFRTFQNTVQEAIDDPSSKAAVTIRRLGLDARKAGEDAGSAFISTIARLKELRETTEGAAATNKAFGSNIGALTRSSEDFTTVLLATRAELERTGRVAGTDAVVASEKLGRTINELSNTWDVFKQNLAASNVGDLIQASLAKFNENVSNSKGIVDLFIKSLVQLGALTQGRVGPVAQTESTLQPQFRGLFELGQERSDAGFEPRFLGPKFRERRPRAPGRSRADTPPNLPTSFDPIISPGMQRAFNIMNDMADAAAAAAKALKELPVVIDTVPDIFQRLGLPFLAGVPPGGAGTAGGAFPGTTTGGAAQPTQITSAREERIQQALGGVFEDFVFQITSARSTISDAFKGLLLGITDTFAAEFAKAFQESLHNAFIKPLASWLEDALSSIFDGISGKGVGKFFKTLGSAFAGAFAEGGTIPAGHWGMVGERGPEIAYAGSGPMQIAPMGGGGGGHITMNFAISTASGEVSQRTQDQIADSAARGLERAQRLRGAR